MSDRSITFLEVHLGDSRIQFGPKTIGKSDPSTTSSDVESEETQTSKSRCSARTVGIALAAVGVVVAIAVVAWKRSGSGDLDAAIELDELSEASKGITVSEAP